MNTPRLTSLDRAREPSAETRCEAGAPTSVRRKFKALILIAAGLSFLLSVYLWFRVDREQGLFVGIWVPSILGLGALLLAGGDRSDG